MQVNHQKYQELVHAVSGYLDHNPRLHDDLSPANVGFLKIMCNHAAEFEKKLSSPSPSIPSGVQMLRASGQ